MGSRKQGDSPDLVRRSLLVAGAATVFAPRIALGQGQNVIRIGVPTKTYWPTIICETAIRQKLFEKEGIKAELTIYRSGAEGFEAIAAGAADLIMNSSSSVAAGLRKGVKVRCVANGRRSESRLLDRVPIFWRGGHWPSTRSTSPAFRSAAAVSFQISLQAISRRPFSIRRSPTRSWTKVLRAR